MSMNIHHLDEIVDVLARKNALTAFTTEVDEGSEKGDNYLGNILRVKLSGAKTVSAVVKVASSDPVVREKMGLRNAFLREIRIYGETFPELEKFQMKMGIQEVFAPYPELYYSNLDDGSETLVLEDLKPSGYKMYNRTVTMDHEHISFVLQNYGRFHALSFAMKYQNPELFRKLTKNMVSVIKREDVDTRKDTHRKQMESLISYFDEETEKEIINKLKSISANGNNSINESMESNDFSVLLHGDCWCNNMLFKYEDKSNPSKPTKMRFVDYQLSCFGSVVLDLGYFVYACASKEVFDNLDQYLQIYYDSLSSFLEELGSNPREQFTLENLKEEWKRSFFYGFIMSSYVIRVMLVDAKKAIRLDEIDEGKDIGEAFIDDLKFDKDTYKWRIRDVIKHLHENNFI